MHDANVKEGSWNMRDVRLQGNRPLLQWRTLFLLADEQSEFMNDATMMDDAVFPFRTELLTCDVNTASLQPPGNAGVYDMTSITEAFRCMTEDPLYKSPDIVLIIREIEDSKSYNHIKKLGELQHGS